MANGDSRVGEDVEPQLTRPLCRTHAASGQICVRQSGPAPQWFSGIFQASRFTDSSQVFTENSFDGMCSAIGAPVSLAANGDSPDAGDRDREALAWRVVVSIR
jgi:hypothetical protein